jgi:hypothetical protein
VKKNKLQIHEVSYGRETVEFLSENGVDKSPEQIELYTSAPVQDNEETSLIKKR